MYKLIRRYLRRVDGGYLALCAVCSALSILVLVSIGQTPLGSNSQASVQLLSTLFGRLWAAVFATGDFCTPSGRGLCPSGMMRAARPTTAGTAWAV